MSAYHEHSKISYLFTKTLRKFKISGLLHGWCNVSGRTLGRTWDFEAKYSSQILRNWFFSNFFSVFLRLRRLIFELTCSTRSMLASVKLHSSSCSTNNSSANSLKMSVMTILYPCFWTHAVSSWITRLILRNSVAGAQYPPCIQYLCDDLE